jgi:hypothetical protein
MTGVVALDAGFSVGFLYQAVVDGRGVRVGLPESVSPFEPETSFYLFGPVDGLLEYRETAERARIVPQVVVPGVLGLLELVDFAGELLKRSW